MDIVVQSWQENYCAVYHMQPEHSLTIDENEAENTEEKTPSFKKWHTIRHIKI